MASLLLWTSVSTTSTLYAGSPADGEDWRPAVSVYHDWDQDVGVAVIGCESAGEPDAVNPSGATGLMQIVLPFWQRFANRVIGRVADLKRPGVNIAVGHALWLDDGGHFGYHWKASRRCWQVAVRG